MEKSSNRNLQHQLAKYSAFAAGVMCFGNPSKAQINYVDIDPDTILCNGQSYFAFDFDQDLQPEISLTEQDDFVYGTQYSQYYTISSHKDIITLYGNNAVLMNSQPYAQFLNSNDPINSAQNFNSITGYIYFLLGSYYKLSIPSSSFVNTEINGVWPGQTNKFLGIRFFIGSNEHYGWIRMDVSSDCDTIIIKDYAWNSVPSQGILAGQPLAIEESASAGKLFYSQEQVVFHPSSITENFQFSIFSSDGKLVHEQSTKGHQSIPVDFLSAGFYIIEVSNNTKKSILKISKD